MEYLDILDCTGKKTGGKISREDAHRSGTWHGAFHCLIIYEREGTGRALFQLRSSEKLIAPGTFDVSVGGHYSSGEDAKTAGPREIREELGLGVNFGDLFPIGKRTMVYCFSPGIKEYEFQDVFLLPRRVSWEDMALQASEVDALLELEIEAGIRLFSGEIQKAEGRIFRTGRNAQPAPVSAGDFVPCMDNYYLRLLLLAQRYLSGERRLLVI
jgi:isopentenyldiphosphate isomerase